MSSPAPPGAADPGQVANTQSQYNLQAGETAQAGSNVNQVNPFGSLTYSQTGTGPGGVPLYTATTQLSPEQQSIFNILQGTQTSAGGQAQSLINNANYGAGNPSDIVGGMTSGTTGDLLSKETSYLNPFFDQQTTSLDAQLKNQGLAPGEPGYDRAMNDLRQSQNQSVTGFLAQAEPQAYQQATSSYLLPLQTAATEMGLSQPGSVTANLAPTNPLVDQPPNYQGAVANQEQMQQANYAAQMGQQNAMMSGMFGIPTAVLGGWAKSGGLQSAAAAL